jgi:PAS domain S-box-containing protein
MSQKPTVLVVDDEPSIHDSIRDLLEENFEVIATGDPHTALELLTQARFAVILADQRMPKLTGDQFLAKAQELSDATRILITGYADIDALIRAVNAGRIHTYVPKPWEPAQLRVTVRKAADHARELLLQKKAAAELALQQEALARSEAALRQQTKLLQSILESMGDGVIVGEDNGKLLFANSAARHMVGSFAYDAVPQPAWGQHYGIYVPGTERLYPTADLPLARAMRGESVDGLELFIRNRDQPEGFFVSVNARPMRDDLGATRGGVAVVRDVTVAKKSEELLRSTKEAAEQASKAKSEFLSRMSHELRTPLNAILGFAQLLELAALPPDHNDSVSQILKGGRHLLSLINEILDLARIEARRLTLCLEPVDLVGAIQETLEFVSPLARERNITVVRYPSAESSVFVHADPQRLRQVLLNLLSNAVKYNTDNGRIEIRHQEARAGVQRVSITDTGLGISDRDRERLFRPFERLAEENDGVEGTGLGLALSKGLVEAMGGQIGVQSAPGTGSIFWFELALSRDQAEGPGQEQSASSIAVEGEASQITVLYIEDNPSNLNLMERIVALRKDVRLIAAARGQLGLELASAHCPDLILLDLHLPDLPGEEVLRRLQDEPATNRIPVVVVSADATSTQIERLLAAGAQEYLTKPLEVGGIVRLFEAVCGKKSDPWSGTGRDASGSRTRAGDRGPATAA